MKRILLILSVLFIINSCKTDFETIAPYKEVMVMYGLMNPNDSIQYVRISKAYLGEGNALVMAQQSDSINYADVLDVRIDRVLNGNIVSSRSLTRVDSIPKDDGIFSTANIVYAYTDSVPDDGSKYIITVHNNQTGLTATSNTGLVGETRRSDGSAGIESPAASSINFAFSGQLVIKFLPGQLGKDYNVTMRFYYTETDSSGVPYTVTKSFDWNLGDELASNSNDELSYLPVRRDFFNIVSANVLPADFKWRRMSSSFQMIITGATEELYTYITLTNPSAGITQDHPFYTNIENGIGLFSSRNIKKRPFSLTPATLDSLQTNPNTSNLHFY